MNLFPSPYSGFILFCFLFISYHGYSQQSVELPSITPPSPTAYQMTQYGDVPVNESTGKISPSIPLYTYQVGRLQLPISLNYQGNGVKVDQAASWTGINWNLVAGGVITRLVRGEDDFNRSGGSSGFASYDYDELSTVSNEQIKDHITNLNLDSEVDLFSFSFPGYSGGFYIMELNGESYEAYLTKNDISLKIEIPYSPPTENGILQHRSREIHITTPDGIKYFFGGLNASEVSLTKQLTTQTFFVEREAQTGFYLYKIKHPLGDEIYFEYEPITCNIYLSKEEVQRNYIGSQGGVCDTSGYIPNDLRSEDFIHNQISAKFIEKIWSNNNDFEVTFNSTTVQNTEIKKHYAKILNNMEIGFNNPIDDPINTLDINKKIAFSYKYPHNGNPNNQNEATRFFLSKVNFYDKNSNKEYSYSLEYNSPEDLPARFSKDQDLLGYFNNMGNSNYLPITRDPTFNSTAGADKSSDFFYASKGVLTDIEYPTGGRTHFGYEPTGYDVDGGNLNSTIEINTPVYINWNSEYNPPMGEVENNPLEIDLGRPTLQGDGSTVINNLVTQYIDINIDNVASSDYLNMVTFFLTVTDIETGHEYTDLVQYDYGNEISSGYDPNFYRSVHKYNGHTFRRIRLTGGQKYEVKVEIGTLSHNNQNTFIYARVNFEYDIESSEHPLLPGIRIQRITDYLTDHSDNTQYISNVKRFYYIYRPTLIKPVYIYSSIDSECCYGVAPGGGQGGATSIYHYYKNLVSNSINNIYSFGNKDPMYKRVRISYGGDNFENGGVEKKFIVQADAGAYPYIMPDIESGRVEYTNGKENKSDINGTLLKETIYGKKNEIAYPIRIKNYDYDYGFLLDDEHVTNNIRMKVFDHPCFDEPADISNLYLGLYTTYSNRLILDSVTDRQYLYDTTLDLSQYDSDNDYIIDEIEANTLFNNDLVSQLETKTTYEYTQHVGMPTKETVSTSTSEEAIETTYTYPSELTLNSTYISEPLRIQKSKKVDGQEIPLSSISRVHSSSGAFPNYNGSKNLLSKVNTVKGPEFDGGVINLEERITYHDYDSMGNPIEVSKTDGTHIVYIWGYNQTLPIAKIENATYCYNGNNYSQSNCLEQTDVENLQLLSNQDIDSISEENLRVALNGLRNSLTNSMVTTYTYDPLIGVTSMTDPRGQVVYYEYDEFNRLEYIKDKDGYILSKNDYRHQTQN